MQTQYCATWRANVLDFCLLYWQEIYLDFCLVSDRVLFSVLMWLDWSTSTKQIWDGNAFLHAPHGYLHPQKWIRPCHGIRITLVCTFQLADLILTVLPVWVRVLFIRRKKLYSVNFSEFFFARPEDKKKASGSIQNMQQALKASQAFIWGQNAIQGLKELYNQRYLPGLLVRMSLNSSWSHGWTNSYTLCPSSSSCR